MLDIVMSWGFVEALVLGPVVFFCSSHSVLRIVIEC